MGMHEYGAVKEEEEAADESLRWKRADNMTAKEKSFNLIIVIYCVWLPPLTKEARCMSAIISLQLYKPVSTHYLFISLQNSTDKREKRCLWLALL